MASACFKRIKMTLRHTKHVHLLDISGRSQKGQLNHTFFFLFLFSFIIPSKKLLKKKKKKKSLQDFIRKEQHRLQHRLDYGHWKRRDLMKNQCPVCLVIRYENSSKAWKLHCHVWLPLLHSWSHQECFPFVQMGAPHS